MKRRTLFGVMAGGIAGLFSPRAVAAPIDHTKPDRDCEANAVCRVYRESADGKWREIRRDAIRPGDRIIMIGQDGDRLWKADAATVGEVVPDCCPGGGFIPDDKASELDLIRGV